LPDKVITHIEQVTSGWLTEVLANQGVLTAGEVTGFEVDRGRGNWSTNARLSLRYSAEARGSLPKNLFLKIVQIDLEDEFFGESEVTYYTRDYVDVPDAPLIRCYDAAFSEAAQSYHILLDNISATHVEADHKKPTLEYGLALADGLAVMHARWWGAQRLTEAQAPIHSSDHIQRFVDIAEPGVGHILSRFTGELEPHWPELIHALFAAHPQAMINRTGNDNGFTLIHGDAGSYNILVPKMGDRPIYLIDRQPFNWSLTTWLGVYDLAYAMVLDWEVDNRRALEIPVLQQYHQQLQDKGIQGYSWEQLFDDYRLCAAMGVYIATEYCRGGLNERWIPVWLSMLQRSLTACDDLQCQELWLPSGGE
jgi:hypothetical protein